MIAFPSPTKVPGPVGKIPSRKSRQDVSEEHVRAALQDFFTQLKWSDADQLALWQKRGLAPSTSRVAGFRSNGPENAAVLAKVAKTHDMDVLLRAGLFERSFSSDDEDSDGEDGGEDSGEASEVLIEGCRPARHFCGRGEVAKLRLDGQSRAKVEGKARELYGRFAPLSFAVADGKLRVMGLNRAPIIPYFNHLPEVQSDGDGPAEGVYDFVLVTEGEFKAWGFWQVFAEDKVPVPPVDRLVALRAHKHWAKGSVPRCFLTPPGGGHVMRQRVPMRVGVCALPGITFAKLRGASWPVAHELHEFIRLSRAQEAMVVYDNEEKGNPALGSYQRDVDRRYDSVVWGIYLARAIQKQTSSCRGLFGMIPDEYRDAHGKADWDGALASMIHDGIREVNGLEGRSGRGGRTVRIAHSDEKIVDGEEMVGDLFGDLM